MRDGPSCSLRGPYEIVTEKEDFNPEVLDVIPWCSDVSYFVFRGTQWRSGWGFPTLSGRGRCQLTDLGTRVVPPTRLPANQSPRYEQLGFSRTWTSASDGQVKSLYPGVSEPWYDELNLKIVSFSMLPLWYLTFISPVPQRIWNWC